ncbi:MAG: DUF4190 domain-containing protein [Blastocatellia bacterium]|nr:DUF4190 domain-containing protein [Blastocatellia bacterium]
MKRCPRCGETYTDADVNFCLNDGELLSRLTGSESPERPQYSNDPPPTIMMDQSRMTNPITWPENAAPVSPYRPPAPLQFNPSFQLSRSTGSDQTLPTLSLILGLASLIFSCCFGGIYFGLPAAIIGLIGFRNADKDSGRYGGKGLAIAGMVIGAITLLIAFLHIIFAVLA